MHIAVLSDTHDRLHPSLMEQLTEADEIWHLGDVCGPEWILELGRLGPPVSVVRGNCDWNMDWPLTRLLDRAGFRCLLVHIPPSTAVTGADIVLHGHTHRPRNEKSGSTLFLNPGPAGLANKGAPLSFAWLDLLPGKTPGWEIKLLH